MKQWNEMEYSRLQFAIEHCKCFGRKIELDDGAFALMAAYIIGVDDGANNLPNEYIDKIIVGLETDMF